MGYVLVDQQLDTYIGLIAIIFTGLGIWLALKLRKPMAVSSPSAELSGLDYL